MKVKKERVQKHEINVFADSENILSFFYYRDSEAFRIIFLTIQTNKKGIMREISPLRFIPHKTVILLLTQFLSSGNSIPKAPANCLSSSVLIRSESK